MAGYVERGEVPGIVTLVSRRGEVHVDAIGMKAVGGVAPDRIAADAAVVLADMVEQAANDDLLGGHRRRARHQRPALRQLIVAQPTDTAAATTVPFP